MSMSDRTFSRLNPVTGGIEWFFNAREGVFGPFPTQEIALNAVTEFVRQKIEQNDDAGRLGGNAGFCMEPLGYSIFSASPYRAN